MDQWNLWPHRPSEGRKLANKDLRDWIGEIDAAGELHHIKGAGTKEDIGGIVDIVQRKMGSPALMFDEIPGFPKGHRVIANLLTSTPRINVALGLPAGRVRHGADRLVARLHEECADDAAEGGQWRASSGERDGRRGRGYHGDPSAGLARA